MRYTLAFLRGQQAERLRQVALAKGKPGSEDFVEDQEAFTLAYFGRMRDSRAMSRRASQVAELASEHESSALYEAGGAVREAFFGYTTEAKASAAQALSHSKDREVVYGAAFAYAVVGDVPQAEKLAGELGKRFGEDTSVRANYLPVLRALFALNRRDPTKAVESVKVAIPYENGTPRTTIHGFFGVLYPAYVRGEAFLASGGANRRSAEFRKILARPGLVERSCCCYGQAATRQSIARRQRKATKASYQEAINLWEHADADFPFCCRPRQKPRNLSWRPPTPIRHLNAINHQNVHRPLGRLQSSPSCS